MFVLDSVFFVYMNIFLNLFRTIEKYVFWNTENMFLLFLFQNKGMCHFKEIDFGLNTLVFLA